jgi:hypothetical protein
MPRVRVKAFSRRTKGGKIARVGASQRSVKGRGKIKRIGGPRVTARGPRTRGESFTKLRSPTKAKDSIGKGPVGGRKSKAPGPRQAARAAATAKAFHGKVTALAKPKNTSTHAAAGLHRLGKKGNRYSDASGKVFHRVGKGSKSRFAAGEPKKGKAKKTSKRKASSKKRARR